MKYQENITVKDVTNYSKKEENRLSMLEENLKANFKLYSIIIPVTFIFEAFIFPEDAILKYGLAAFVLFGAVVISSHIYAIRKIKNKKNK